MCNENQFEYIIAGEEYPFDAVKFWSVWTKDNIELLVSDAAAQFYKDELSPDAFTIDIEIFSEGRSLGEFEVFIEFHLTFSVSKKR